MPGTAQAHAMFGSVAPFWSGVLHVLVTPLALAAVATLVLALAESSESSIIHAVVGAALAAFCSAELASSQTMQAYGAGAIAAACVVVICILEAFWRRPAPWPACVLGVGCGIATGLAVAADVPGRGGSFGVGITLLVLASWGAAAITQLQQRCATRLLVSRRIAAISIAVMAIVFAVA